MSRGFVKEDDLEHAGTDVPERPVSTHPNYVTVNGYKQLQQMATALEQEMVSLKASGEQAATQQRLVIVNRDLRYVAARLESALVVDPKQTKADVASQQVLFGATVTVEDEDGASHIYEIVGEDEADIKANKVSWTSPLAKSLIGHKVGENVVWTRPAGNTVLEIIAINY